MSEKTFTAEVVVRLTSSMTEGKPTQVINECYIVKLVNDVASQILIKHDGDEGICLQLTNIKFKKPLYSGDVIKIEGVLDSETSTTRVMSFKGFRTIKNRLLIKQPSNFIYLDEPESVLEAEGVYAVPLFYQKDREDVTDWRDDT